ncbi:MAG TPA: polysaccharide biosynthesis tyrosine autokinase [Solirubrobacterales bacterium]|nr:polysaccharide biosynthesis tyrosine autokinase [Solirubrobacterales bacterium]
MTPNTKSEESDFSAFARTLRRRWWVVLLCIVVATAAAVGITLHAEKKYAATTSLLLRVNPEVEPQRVVDTNLQLLSLPNVASRTAERLPDVSQAEIEEAISSEQQGESDIIKVRAETSDPDTAAEIANAYATEFIAMRRTTPHQGPQTGAVQTVEQATPNSSPVSPKPTRNVAFGVVIGLVLGIGLALLLEQLDRRVKSQDDIADTMGIPLLATVAKRKAFDRKHLGNGEMSPEDLEAFRMLRANLRYFDSSRDVKSVLVTSAEPGEGKTLISLGLALAAAAAGERVLLLEADLRDPGLSRVLKLPQVAGLSRTLTEGGQAVADATTAISAGELTKAAGEATFDVAPAGAVPANPPALLESQAMREFIAEAEKAYDFIVIDTPPLLAVADAIPLISIVSGVLVVSGLGVSTRSSAGDLVEQLYRLNASILGLVVNFAQGGQRSYGYGRPAEIAAARPRDNA